MRRAPIVLSATVAGVAAVLGFHPHQPTLPTATAASTPPTPAGATRSSKPSARTATGDAVPTQYGNAQVRVTVENGKITQIEPLQLQGNDPKSLQISSFAEPLLRQSALAKQSASIDVVSGATFTSASYEASLQSALDRLGFKAADGSRGSAQLPQVQERHGRGGPGPFGP